MKQIIRHFFVISAVVVQTLLFPGVSHARCDAESSQQRDLLLDRMDSVEISLLTAGPGNEVWSLYGHTAIRYNDKANDEDLAINYGMFSFEKSFFIARFVLGLTDYEMGITSMDHFINSYGREGRWVVQQDLNLTREEKLELTLAINENNLPENRVYRYNYFYNNCTTKARDMVINHLNISRYTSDNQWNKNSYRNMVHQWTSNYRWTRFGNDLLLGVGSDLKTEKKASFFLPDSVRKDFDNIILINPDGSKRKLVEKKTWLIKPTKAIDLSTPALITPTIVFGVLFCIIFLLSIIQWIYHKNMWLLDATLLTTTGLAGMILFIMIFSQHPTVRFNLQILLLNPISLFLVYPVVKNERRGVGHWYWKVIAICMLMFFIGGFFQTYAEGMLLLALTMLIRILTQTSQRRCKHI